MRQYRSHTERRISAEVVAAMFLHQINRSEMAGLLGMTRPQLTNRLEGRTRWAWAEIELVQSLLPRLDSNQQPADYRPGSAA